MTRYRYVSTILTLGLAGFCHSAIAGAYPVGSGTQTFDFPNGTTDLADGSTIGADVPPGRPTPMAGIFDNTLRLLDRASTNSIGSFKLPDLDPNSVVRVFDAKFNVFMDKDSTQTSGEGWAFSFGPIPGDNGTGEGGFAPFPQGLTIAWDTLNNGEDPNSIQISIGGIVIGNFPRVFTYSPISKSAAIHWDEGGLDVSFEGKVVCTDLATPGFVPRVGNTAAFTSRNGTGGMELKIDNLKFTTTALPAIDTGGVIISEFVADNTVFEDEYTQKPSWLELFNGTDSIQSLDGWFLTDSKSDLTQWKIQGLSLNPYTYRVVFASGRDRQAGPLNWIHTNFKLADEGGYVALVRPDGKTVASAYEYGPQTENVAYGEAGVQRAQGYLFPASPGTVNSQTPSPGSICPEVTISHPGGILLSPVSVLLSVSNLPNAQIRYTLDRTEPTTNSPLYTAAIPITAWTTLKTRAFASGRISGRTTSRSFIFIDASLSDYNGEGKVFHSNLPLIFVDSFGVNIDGTGGGSNPFKPGFAMVLAPDPVTGRTSLTNAPEYAGPCGVHRRGESSLGFDQRSYALEIQDDAGADKDARLLGMSENSDWVLYGPWSEKTLMRNKLVFDWMRSLRGNDGMAVRTRFVELFFNQSKPSTGKIGFSSYRGIYVLMEKMKRGTDRVPLENLNDKTVDPTLITGGYIIRKDKDDALKNNWTSTGGIPLQSFDPDRLNPTQFNYIRGYIASFETALNKADFRNFRTGYQAYIDPDTFIDAQWMLEVAKQVDGYVFSTYWHKDRSGRLRAGPLWDFNISLGNADYATGETPAGWLYDGANGIGQLWYPRLHSDPSYKLAHWDRYWHMRKSILATETIVATVKQHMATLLDGYTGLVSNRAPATIQNPVARHFRKWPRLGTRDWPNPAAETRIRTWQAEVDYMVNWVSNRLQWLDTQSLRVGKIAYRPPVLSHSGGHIQSQVTLGIRPFAKVETATTYPDGVVYYTTDGTDPRLPNGTVSSSAKNFEREFMVESSGTINARMQVGSTWSPLATATFLLDAHAADASNLVISEILYQPPALKPDELGAGIIQSEKLEFIELRNISKKTIDLMGVRMTRGVAFDFSFAPAAQRLLLPGETVLVVSDTRAFALAYPEVPSTRVAGSYLGQLDNSGESLRVEAADGSVIKQFQYDDTTPWPQAGDGSGKSLVLASPGRNPNPGDPFNWLPSASLGGTPGTYGTGSTVFLGIPNEDSDLDGTPDLFEFASGTDPENPDSISLPHVSSEVFEILGVSRRYLVLEYRRDPRVAGVTFQLESSPSLESWNGTQANLVPLETRANPDGTVTDRFRSSTPLSDTTNPSFLRLKVMEQ